VILRMIILMRSLIKAAGRRLLIVGFSLIPSLPMRRRYNSYLWQEKFQLLRENGRR